jgi:hypothetical protein
VSPRAYAQTLGIDLLRITTEGITRWFHKMRNHFFIKNSIYFVLLVHRQEYRYERHFCFRCRNFSPYFSSFPMYFGRYWVLYKQILSYFVKPSSDQHVSPSAITIISTIFFKMLLRIILAIAYMNRVSILLHYFEILFLFFLLLNSYLAKKILNLIMLQLQELLSMG